MTEFLNWCNSNVGFVSVLLSALTLLVSVIAVVVSIHTARLPYKKKVLVSAGNTISDMGIGLHITATNIGNRNITIKTIGFLIDAKVYVNKNTLFDSQISLAQGVTTSQYYDLNEFKTTLASMKANPLTMIKAFVEDSEGTRYKKNLALVKTIIKLEPYESEYNQFGN